MIRRWFILVFLVLVMIVLLWNFYKGVVVYHSMEDVVKMAQKAPQKPPKEIPAYAPAWNAPIVDKNLFSKTRGYTPPAPAAADKPVDAVPEIELVPPDLALNGIILDQYGEFVAFIQSGGQQPKRVRKGDMFDGVLVVDISPREVKLLWNNKEMTLSMKKIKTVPKKK